ncbi:hypothetical protein CONLIGDRAFT_181326 [Coniochaeta ligniaria NRRL 30616]|uniref:Membrane-associated proteins in eicosanoid and glutathione metabolism n=1 Tax=Coniochaeta ligniaria NRRL 30616 TaxID=1408157 RepID=A0A1J7JVV8_9PEZI|nr:hypothetical protein CONLIGDRAFT_181326 [Coniochaeta ligniaria NRRL 30616]
MASLFDLTKAQLSYYTVPAAMILLYVPHTYAGIKAGKNQDNANPRKTEEHLAKDDSINKVTKSRILRARAAHANGNETIGLYAAAVVAANVAGVEAETVNYLALGYVASRIVYNYIYVIAQDNSRVAPLRSLTWVSGIGIIMTLFVKAGNAAANVRTVRFS